MESQTMKSSRSCNRVSEQYGTQMPSMKRDGESLSEGLGAFKSIAGAVGAIVAVRETAIGGDWAFWMTVVAVTLTELMCAAVLCLGRKGAETVSGRKWRKGVIGIVIGVGMASAGKMANPVGELMMPWANVLAYWVVVPIAEEILFRGAVRRVALESWGPVGGRIATCAAFAVAHIRLDNASAWLWYVAYGASFELAASVGGGLLASIAAHMTVMICLVSGA